MIALFNNTDLAWRVKKNSQNTTFTEVSVSTKTKEGDFKSLKISMPSEIDMTKIGTTKSEAMQDIFTESTNIFYDNKTNSPNIGTVGGNKDIFLISIDIKGCSIVDMTRQDLFVIGFLIMRGCFFMVASVKEGCSGFYITKYNKETKLETSYKFNIGKNGKTLAERCFVEIESSKVNKNYDHFKIRSFRPSRATHLVFINEKDKDIAETYMGDGKLFSAEKNNIVYFTDDNFSDLVKEQLAAGYSAATIFTGLEEVLNNQFGDYDDDITLMRTVFNVNNIILGGATPPTVLKR